MERFLGEDYYFVHFNRKPGVADAILERNTGRFLSNIFRKNIPPTPHLEGMLMIHLAEADQVPGDLIMTDREMKVYTDAFQVSGFASNINWYRNLDRNWHLLEGIDPIIRHPSLMIYGQQDVIPKPENFVEIRAQCYGNQFRLWPLICNKRKRWKPIK